MFAIYGGTSTSGLDNNLYILDVATITWVKKPLVGDIPLPLATSTIKYHDNYLYLAAGDDYAGIFQNKF